MQNQGKVSNTFETKRSSTRQSKGAGQILGRRQEFMNLQCGLHCAMLSPRATLKITFTELIYPIKRMARNSRGGSSCGIQLTGASENTYSSKLK